MQSTTATTKTLKLCFCCFLLVRCARNAVICRHILHTYVFFGQLFTLTTVCRQHGIYRQCLLHRQIFSVGLHYLLVPVGTFLRRTFLRGVIHIDQSEAFRVACRPFEVVHKCPIEVACYGVGFGNTFQHFDVPANKIYPHIIGHFAVKHLPLCNRNAVFRKNNWQTVTLVVVPDDVFYAFGRNLLAHRRHFVCGRKRQFSYTVFIFFDIKPLIIVDAEEIEVALYRA